MVKNNWIPNCPITVQDVLAAEDIFGPDIGCLNGKRTWADPMRVETTGVPVMIMERYCEVSLSADIMMINRIQFLITFLQNL
jgi:hypothetical protein